MTKDEFVKLAEKQAVDLNETLKLLGSPFEIAVWGRADKSDPLNQILMVCTTTRSEF